MVTESLVKLNIYIFNSFDFCFSSREKRRTIATGATMHGTSGIGSGSATTSCVCCTIL